METSRGPTSPPAPSILGRSGARKAYLTGRGSVILRAKTHTEEIRKDRWAIVVDEIPYQVNKATLVERIAELAKEKKVEGIAHVQDESDRFGVRVVVELKRDATPDVVLNQLYRFTPMQTSFGCNMLALNNGRPETLDLKTHACKAFIAFREEVVARRTAFLLRKARERAHLLCGLAVAVSNVDEVVATIRGSADAAEAREKLMTRRWPAEDIAGYIRLDRRSDPHGSTRTAPTISPRPRRARSSICASSASPRWASRRSATSWRRSPARSPTTSRSCAPRADPRDHRRTSSPRSATSSPSPAAPRSRSIAGDLEDEDLIEREDMVVTITHGGYIKRTPLAEYRAQKRGGKGLSGMATKDEDFITRLFVANTHTPLLFFTTDGMVYKLKTWRLPSGGRAARGKADRQPAADRTTGVRHRLRSCRSTVPEDRSGRASRSSSPPPSGRCPAQRALRLHQRDAQRQDRDAACPTTIRMTAADQGAGAAGVRNSSDDDGSC